MPKSRRIRVKGYSQKRKGKIVHVKGHLRMRRSRRS